MLNSIHSPADIKQLDLSELQSLADEIHKFLNVLVLNIADKLLAGR
jgi:deoxyxylulose-5-phosphate synthase